MNALAIGYVNAHLQEIIEDSAQQRRAHVGRPSAVDRIRSAASRAKASLACRSAIYSAPSASDSACTTDLLPILNCSMPRRRQRIPGEGFEGAEQLDRERTRERVPASRD